jgi:hypothetical protein
MLFEGASAVKQQKKRAHSMGAQVFSQEQKF